MSAKIADIIKSTRGYMHKHSPEILTGIGIFGMITSTVLAVQATPKALSLIDDKKEELSEEYGVTVNELPYKEIVKVTWKQYIPSVAIGVTSICCIVGASTISTKRNAALATAYTISEKALTKYRDKVIETIGEKKEKEIRGKIAQDDVDKDPASKTQVFLTSKGNTLCKDSLSGRYFRSDLDQIRKAINELNREMTYQNYVSLNDLYGKLGLDSIKQGDRLGWNLDYGLIEIDFDTCLSDNEEPCVVIDYTLPPRYDFDRMF